MVLLVAVMAMLGSATKLQTARKVKLDGAVTGEANFDGSKDVTINTKQNNIAVITGKVTLAGAPASETNEPKQTAWTINFPKGFNKDNCVCIAFGGRMYDDRGFNYGLGDDGSFGIVTGDIPRSITLGYKPDPTKIHLSVENIANSDHIYEYRIVLMKLDESEDYIAGDINGDGEVTIEDKNLALNYGVGQQIDLSWNQFKAGDMNKDGIIDARDASRIGALIE